MTGLSQFFEFTAANFVNGQARVLFSKLSNGTLTDQAVPANPSAIFAQTSALSYAAVTASDYSPWVDLGGTSSPPEYSRDVSLNEWKIQQQLTAVELVPNEIVRTVKIPAMEFARNDLLEMFENGAPSETIAAVSSDSTPSAAYTETPFGQFTDLNQYRVAFAAFAGPGASLVTEPDGNQRPAFIVQTFLRCSISAENVSTTWELGQPVHADLTLRLYLEPGQDQNQEAGSYFIETPGSTITT